MQPDSAVIQDDLDLDMELALAIDAASAPVSMRLRLEDALDFLETLPDFIGFGLEEVGGSRIHYFLEPDEIMRAEAGVELTGSNLLVQIVMERTGYKLEIDTAQSGREQLILTVTPDSLATANLLK